jgi:hypothetical protein
VGEIKGDKADKARKSFPFDPVIGKTISGKIEDQEVVKIIKEARGKGTEGVVLEIDLPKLSGIRVKIWG